MFSRGFGPSGPDDYFAPQEAPTGWQRRQRVALVGGLIVVVVALLGGGAAYALPGLFQADSATVTVTPRSSDLKVSYTLAAVTGTPDASKQQVGARLVPVTTPAQTQTVPATGSKTTPGTHAKGTLGVINYDIAHSLTLAAGATFPNNNGCPAPNGLVMVLDATVTLPPASSGSPSNTTVSAHVLQVGPVGNFTYAALHHLSFSPLGGCSAFVYLGGNCPGSDFGNCVDLYSNSAFTGGTNPHTVTVVAQNDIATAAQNLISANQPDAQQVVQAQLQPNEQLVGTPQCTPKMSANHQAGDVANTVTVTVTFTCTGEAYDDAGALALAVKLLKDQAATTPGAGYALVGQVKTTLLNATPGTHGTVQVMVQAEGIWAYLFTAMQKQTMAQLIAGKSEQEARQVLTAQPGVSGASITFSDGLGQTLPTDPAKITLVVQTISGF